MSKNCHKQISRHRYKSPKLKQEQQQRNTFRLSVAKQKKNGDDNEQSAQRKIP